MTSLASKSGPTYLIALLAGALALTGLLAYQAVDAARSHRITAEQTLSDYAGFAAWEFSRQARADLSRAFMEGRRRLAPSGMIVPGASLPEPPRDASLECPGDCPVIRPIHHFFTVDLDSESLQMSGSETPAEFRQWLADTVAHHAEAYFDLDWGYALLPLRGGTDRLAFYALEVECETRTPYLAYGFIFDGASLDPIFQHILSEKDLMPPTLLAGIERDSLLQASVLSMAARYDFRSALAPHSAYRSAAPLGASFSDFEVELSLAEAIAPSLVIGGLPGNRLPLLGLLLFLTCGLLVAALRQFKKEYELAGLRADFVSSVSHELRTPLAQIRMFSETLMLNRTRSNGEKDRSLRIIDQEARRLSHLVDNVLLFSKSDRKKMRLYREPAILGDLVQETMESFAPIASAAGMTLLNLCTGSHMAAVDRAVMRQVLINLLDNAVKYGPPGQTIVAGVEVKDDRVEIAIEDEGPGIPDAEAARVWEPFVRLHRHDASNVAGSGIGLAVVKEYVALHDGSVRVEPRPGGGSRFVISLNLLHLAEFATSGDGAATALPENA